jgi:tumor protein p53-inducible protein 3
MKAVLVKKPGGAEHLFMGEAGKPEPMGRECKTLGPREGFNYKEGPFAPKLLEATEGEGVDVILDFVGASFWEQNIQSLKREGRLIVIGYLGGSRVPQVDLTPILRKWIRVIGTTLRARDLSYQVKLARALADFSLRRFADGRLRPIIDRVFPWDRVQEAHRYMEANRNIGKIILNGM